MQESQFFLYQICNLNITQSQQKIDQMNDMMRALGNSKDVNPAELAKKQEINNIVENHTNRRNYFANKKLELEKELFPDLFVEEPAIVIKTAE